MPESNYRHQAIAELPNFLRDQTTAIYESACTEPACSESSCSPLLTRTLTSTRRFSARPLASELLATDVSLHSPRVPRRNTGVFAQIPGHDRRPFLAEALVVLRTAGAGGMACNLDHVSIDVRIGGNKLPTAALLFMICSCWATVIANRSRQNLILLASSSPSEFPTPSALTVKPGTNAVTLMSVCRKNAWRSFRCPILVVLLILTRSIE